MRFPTSHLLCLLPTDIGAPVCVRLSLSSITTNTKITTG